MAEDAWECSVEARVGLTGQMQTVASDHLRRVLEDFGNVRLVLLVANKTGLELVLKKQLYHEFGRVKCALLCNFSKSQALITVIRGRSGACQYSLRPID